MQHQQMQEVRPGDRVAVVAHRVGGERRTGEVIEVLGEPGHVRCKVRWDDGAETFVYAGAELVVEPAEFEEIR